MVKYNLYIISMKRQIMLNCCAVSLLYEFGNTYTALDTTKYSNQEIKDFIESSRNSYSKDKIEVIFLNDEQLDNIGKNLFIELGYKITKLGLYPGHGSIIYLLTYNPNKKIKKKDG